MSSPEPSIVALRHLGDRLAAAPGLEAVVDISLEGLDELLGHSTSLLLVHQPELDRLVTLASRGYDAEGVGSEVALGEGVIGMAGARRQPMRIGNLQRMLSYARSVQRTTTSEIAEIRLPGLADAVSQMAAPLVAGGGLLGVLAVETRQASAYDEQDEHVFAVAAHLVAAALEREELSTGELDRRAPIIVSPSPSPSTSPASTEVDAVPPTRAPVVIRHYAVDGSTFLDDSYVIKGVAGRLLWKLIADHAATGRTSFTNREAKLDPGLGLPSYRDNFESRLILLKRRLDEHEAPLRITSSGRGLFDLHVSSTVVLEHIQNV